MDYEDAQKSQFAPGMNVPNYARNAAQGEVMRKQTPADAVRANAERATMRLSQLRENIISLQERICGAMPTRGEQVAADALSASGFINGTGSAVERIHIEISAIDEVLASIAQVI